ncbi:MAG: phosphoribosylanthranilate isomerase [Lachnospiraceae bacterium]|nr:phosphoribosylanthranilate isomerase [Lachnospiraceae bacterium]
MADGTIDIAQLHGSEDDAYVARLRKLIEENGAGCGAAYRNPGKERAAREDGENCNNAAARKESESCENRTEREDGETGEDSSDQTHGKIRIIKAFKVASEEDVRSANLSTADMILLDSGAGSGKEFDWSVLGEVRRPYFLAGGLDADSAERAIERLRPYALDVSSGIETDGFKDRAKMERFMAAVHTAR